MTNSNKPPIPMPLDECRQAFEDDCAGNDVYIGRHYKFPEQYQLYETQLRWMGFQAAWNTHTYPILDQEGLVERLEKLRYSHEDNIPIQTVVDSNLMLDKTIAIAQHDAAKTEQSPGIIGRLTARLRSELDEPSYPELYREGIKHTIRIMEEL